MSYLNSMLANKWSNDQIKEKDDTLDTKRTTEESMNVV